MLRYSITPDVEFSVDSEGRVSLRVGDEIHTVTDTVHTVAVESIARTRRPPIPATIPVTPPNTRRAGEAVAYADAAPGTTVVFTADGQRTLGRIDGRHRDLVFLAGAGTIVTTDAGRWPELDVRRA